MKFSLINVEKEENGIIEGVWLQDHTGTLKTAIENAIATEKANNDRLDIAVVEALGFTKPNYSLQKGLKRLDKCRNIKLKPCPNCKNEIKIYTRCGQGAFAVCEKCKSEFNICGPDKIPLYHGAKFRKSTADKIKRIWNKMF